MIKYISILIFSLTLLTSSSFKAQGIYLSSGSGDWNLTTTWSTFAPFPPYFFPATSTPGATDIVSIQSGHTVTVTAAAAANAIYVDSRPALAQLTINSGVTLTADTINVKSSTTGNAVLLNNGTTTIQKVALDVNTGSVSLNNNGTFTTDTTYFVENTGTITINLTTGSQYTTRKVNATNTSAANTIIDMSSGSGVFRLREDFNGSDITFNGGNSGSRIQYIGNTPQIINSSIPTFTFNEIRVSNSSGASLDGPLTTSNTNGDLRTAGSGIINQNGFDINIPTRIFINTTGTFNSDANITLGTNLVNQGIFNLGGLLTIGNDLTNSGTLTANGDLDITRHFTNSGTFTSNGSNINVERNWNNTGTYTYATGDIVSLDGTGGNSNISGTTEFYEFNVNKTGMRVNVATGDVINIRNFLNIDAGELRVTTGNVTLLSDASGTAQLDVIESGASYTGDLEVQRLLAMSNDGWREITSPVASSTLANWQDDGIILTGFPGADYDASNWYGWINSWTYTEANAAGVKDNGWVAATSNTDATTFTKGHRIYIGTGNNTLSVKGTPVQGLQSAPITNGGTGTDENGWNLIGNPYACTIDWNSLATSNTDAAIWIWNATSGNYGVYQTGAATGTHGVDNEIAHSQAFWVHATGASGSVIFQESNKVRSDKAIVKSNSSEEYVKIKLSSSVNSFYDEALLTFNEAANDNFNEGIDQNKLYTELEDLAPSLAIVTSDNAELSIAGINELKSRSIPLKAYAGNTAYGTYTIEFELPANSLLNSCITLEDLETGSITDLKTVNNYTFTTTANSPQDRFILHITAPFETEIIEPSCSNLTDGIISLEGSNINGNTFTISNSNGVLNTINGSNNQISFSNLTAGIYTITSSQVSTCGYNSIEVSLNAPQEVIASFTLNDNIIYLDQNATISPINNSFGENYTWDFGDGTTSNDENPTYSYSNPGIYTVTLTVEKNGCETTTTETIEVRTSTSISEETEINYTIISNDNSIVINLEENLSNGNLALTTLNGKVVVTKAVTSTTSSINTTEYAQGIYLLTISSDEGKTTKKVMIK